MGEERGAREGSEYLANAASTSIDVTGGVARYERGGEGLPAPRKRRSHVN
jgi:hypothetical protein